MISTIMDPLTQCFNKREYSFGSSVTKLEEGAISTFAIVSGPFKVNPKWQYNVLAPVEIS
jgi:hypothetical protein